MADLEEDDLQMAIRMSMQHAPPEPKRNKPRDSVVVDGVVSGTPEESPEAKSRRVQRELMAAAAEKRMVEAETARSNSPMAGEDRGEVGRREVEEGGRLMSVEEADELFAIVFGSEVSKGILAQWSNQGIRYSSSFLGCMVICLELAFSISLI